MCACLKKLEYYNYELTRVDGAKIIEKATWVSARFRLSVKLQLEIYQNPS